MWFSSFLWLSALSSSVNGADENSFVINADIPYSNEVASQQIFDQQVFGNSWNTPANASYSPPDTDFDRVVLELQVNSTGANYDRLSQLFVDDVEIWRTSTAEPDNHGTTWTVRKDVSHYSTLFKSDHVMNFLIANRVTDQFTGVFYVSLLAKFYKDPGSQATSDDSWLINLDNPPNNVKALTKSASTPSGSWSAPGDDISVEVDPLDRSVNRAVVHIFASGNGDDEFWWDASHTKDSAGPGRFIDVYIGGQFAGFASPYPVIYTGGVNPYLWKPMVDIRTFDVPAYFVDVTPFLPVLWDKGAAIKLNVTNGVDAEEVPSNWIISYNLLTWSADGQSNSGTLNNPQYDDKSPSGTAATSVIVRRNLTTSASLTLGGQQHDVKWEQSVGYNNTLTSENSSNSHVWQNTDGTASVTGPESFDNQFSYPFQCEMDSNYYRVQQSLNVLANNQSYSQWIDSSLTQDDQGSFSGSNSRQYLGLPHGNHFAETRNLEVVNQW